MLCHGSRCYTAGFKIKRNGSIFSCARTKPRSLDSKIVAAAVVVIVVVVYGGMWTATKTNNSSQGVTYY